MDNSDRALIKHLVGLTAGLDQQQAELLEQLAALELAAERARAAIARADVLLFVAARETLT